MNDVLSTNARWFDGRDNRARLALVRLQGRQLELLPHPGADPDQDEAGLRGDSVPGLDAHPTEGAPRFYPRASLQVGERWRGTPMPVVLPDGGTVWLSPDSAVARQLAPRGPAAWLISRWSGAVTCLLILVALVVWFDRQGAGVVAQAALPLIPERLDDAIGNRAEQGAREWLKPSHLAPWRREALTKRFDAMADRQFPHVGPELHFARVNDDESGFNAFALPNGAVYLLDGMSVVLTDDELMAVLAHEVAHVKHRHAVRSIAAGAGLFMVAGTVLGDFSTVAAQSVGALQTLHYSRDAEREADAEAQRVIVAEGLPPDTLVKVWRKLKARVDESGQLGFNWLSTHPPTDERIDSALQAMTAASQPVPAAK